MSKLSVITLASETTKDNCSSRPLFHEKLTDANRLSFSYNVLQYSVIF